MLKKIKEKPWIVAVVIFGLYYGLITLIDTGTRCVYKNLFGIPCPGCGMTRSYLHLLKGEWKEAFYDHPLFILVPVIVVLSILMLKQGLSKRAHRILSVALLVIAAVFILMYIYRMVLLFPDKDPLKFYDRGLYPTLYRWVTSLLGH